LSTIAGPLLLTTGRILEHFHTGSMSHRSRVLEALAPESRIEMNPVDTDRLGIEEGDLISLSSRRGEVQAKVRLTVLERSAEDNKFLAALAKNPAGALSSYGLTPAHRKALIHGDIASIENWVGPLEERLQIWLKARLRRENFVEEQV